MDFKTTVPIWLQVAHEIKSDIVSGKLQPGEKMQSSRSLAVQYAINPNTAARVYQELERDGVCETRRGLGTFVTEDETKIRLLRHEMAMEAVETFLQTMKTLGISQNEAMNMLTQWKENEHA